jgi:hypothetical protein
LENTWHIVALTVETIARGENSRPGINLPKQLSREKLFRPLSILTSFRIEQMGYVDVLVGAHGQEEGVLLLLGVALIVFVLFIRVTQRMTYAHRTSHANNKNTALLRPKCHRSMSAGNWLLWLLLHIRGAVYLAVRGWGTNFINVDDRRARAQACFKNTHPAFTPYFTPVAGQLGGRQSKIR